VDLVAQVLADAEEKLERKYRLADGGYTLNRLIERVAKILSLDPRGVTAPEKDRRKVEARSLLCYWGTVELGSSQTELAQRIPLLRSVTL